MDIDIENCFELLLEQIEPRDSDYNSYESHRNSITKRLQAVFLTNKVELIGSFRRGTAISGSSDIDLILVLSKSEVVWGERWKSSKTILNNLRDQLRNRYWNTYVGIDKQAVTANFADGKHPVDVVPAVYLDNGGVMNYPIFAIPDGDGNWMQTSPHAHNKFIKDADTLSGGTLKQTAKLIKFWRECRTPNIPLNMFYMEMVLANEEICQEDMSLGLCFNNALAHLANSDCEILDDPVEVSGEIEAANSEAKIKILRQAAQTFADKAYNALIAENNDDTEEAFRLWDLIFNGYFPDN
jgi:hypothetical protein